jgi:hypothetical protein
MNPDKVEPSKDRGRTKKLFSASGAIGYVLVSGLVLVLMILAFMDLNRTDFAYKQFNAAMAPIIAVQ